MKKRTSRSVKDSDQPAVAALTLEYPRPFRSAILTLTVSVAAFNALACGDESPPSSPVPDATQALQTATATPNPTSTPSPSPTLSYRIPPRRLYPPRPPSTLPNPQLSRSNSSWTPRPPLWRPWNQAIQRSKSSGPYGRATTRKRPP